MDEAKEELQEIIEFLREPQKFQKLGGRIPKGVLLMGPPGTGKTLLARAIAGEANVPFFSISGSDFVEMFVGVGASRVRDLFEQGKKNAPCIIFIDEIDAVGRHRGAGLGGGHDEREQTLNQLLVEMDGFESNDGVILIAATNRPDVLDPALLRPGRFDRRVVVSRPDVRGREGILQVHTRKIPLTEDVDIEVLARATPGFCGADLANLVNEAALLAARRNQKFVMMADFESSKDKVLMGAERKSMIITDEEKKVTAYHEAGHALLAALLPHTDPLHKVTIIPRGMALGVTQQLPTEEKHNYTKEQLESRIAVCMGGRIAEDVTFGQITTGAQNDIEQATEMARKMVCEWGMSEALGPLTYGKKEEQIFLGKEFNRHQDYSEATALKIDAEIKRIVSEQYDAGGEDPRREARRPRPHRGGAARARGPGRRAAHADHRGTAHGHPDPETRDAGPRRGARGEGGRGEGRRDIPAHGAEAHLVGARRAPLEAAPLRAAELREGGATIEPRAQERRPQRASPPRRRLYPIRLRGEDAVLGERTWVMGVLNVTPDSFSDGGRFLEHAVAVHHGLAHVRGGRGHRGRGRRVHPSGRRGRGGRRRGVPARGARHPGPARPRGGPALRRHHQGRGGARGPGRRRRHRQRRERVPLRSRHGRAWWRNGASPRS